MQKPARFPATTLLRYLCAAIATTASARPQDDRAEAHVGAHVGAHVEAHVEAPLHLQQQINGLDPNPDDLADYITASFAGCP